MERMAGFGWDTTTQRPAMLAAYGLAMFRKRLDAERSSVLCEAFEKVNYEGRPVILDDGRCWGVDPFGVSTDDMLNVACRLSGEPGADQWSSGHDARTGGGRGTQLSVRSALRQL